jgi:hypothetical protein
MTKKKYSAAELFMSESSAVPVGAEESGEREGQVAEIKEADRVPAAVNPAADDAKHETKSKRLNLLIQPTLFEAVQKIAYVKDISVNEAVNDAVRDYNEANSGLLQLYDRKKGIA